MLSALLTLDRKAPLLTNVPSAGKISAGIRDSCFLGAFYGLAET